MKKIEEPSFEQLQQMYQQLQQIRTECHEKSQQFQTYLQDDALADISEVQSFATSLQSLCATQTEFCDALAVVKIVPTARLQDIEQSLKKWNEEQKLQQARSELLAKVQLVLAIEYTGPYPDVPPVLQHIKDEVSELSSLALDFDELAKRAEKYLNLLDAVQTNGMVDQSLANNIMGVFGPSISMACIYHQLHIQGEESIPVKIPKSETLGTITTPSKGKEIGNTLQTKQEDVAAIPEKVIPGTEVNAVQQETEPDTADNTEPDANDGEGDDGSSDDSVAIDPAYLTHQASFTIEQLEENPLKNKVSTGKRFMNELAASFRGYASVVKLVLGFLSKGLVIENKQLDIDNRADKGLKEDEVLKRQQARQNLLQKFLQWGIIGKYLLQDKTIYLMTEGGRKILEQQTVKSKLDIKKVVSIPKFDNGFMPDVIRALVAQYVLMYILDKEDYQSVKAECDGCEVVATIQLGMKDNKEKHIIIFQPYFAELSAQQVMDNIEKLKSSAATIIIIADTADTAAFWTQELGENTIGVTFDTIDTNDFFQPTSEGGEADNAVDTVREEMDTTAVDNDIIAGDTTASDEDIPEVSEPGNNHSEESGTDSDVSKEMLKRDEDTVTAIKHTEGPADVEQEDSSTTEIPTKAVSDQKELVLPIQTQGEVKREISHQVAPLPEVKVGEKLQECSDWFKENYLAEGMLLLHVLKKRVDNTGVQELCNEVSYVVDDPYVEKDVDTTGFTYWDAMLSIPQFENSRARDYLGAFSMVKSFYSPDPTDYRLKNYWNRIKEDKQNIVLQQIPEMKQLLSLFKTFIDETKQPFAMCCNKQSRDQEQMVELKKRIQDEVTEQLERLVANEHSPVNHPRVRGVIERLYGKDGLVIQYFKNIEQISVENIKEFCAPFLNQPLEAYKNLQDITEDSVNDNAISEYLDENWFSIDVSAKKKERFIGKDKTKQVNVLRRSVVVLARYILCSLKSESIVSVRHVEPATVEKNREKALAYVDAIIPQIDALPAKDALEHLAIIAGRLLVQRLKAILENEKYSNRLFYSDFLKSSYVELDSDYLPDFQTDFGVPGFDILHRLDMHMEVMRRNDANLDWQKAYDNTFVAYNLQTGKLIKDAFTAVAMPKALTGVTGDALRKSGEKYLEDDMQRLQSQVEKAVNYGKISGKDKMDRFFAAAEEAGKHFRKTENFGMFKCFAKSCLQTIEEEAVGPHDEMQREFDEFKSRLQSQSPEATPDDFRCLQVLQQWLNENKLTVVEDYLKRCDGKSLSEVQNILNQSYGSNSQDFKAFIKDYEQYYRHCNQYKRNMLDRIFEYWSTGNKRNRTLNRKVKDEKAFVSAWANITSGKNIEKFLAALSYDGEVSVKIARNTTGNRFDYTIQFKDAAPAVTSYAHTFAVFGTKVYQKGLRVIVYVGTHAPQSIVNELNTMGVSKDVGTIFVLDYALSLSERRELAELMKLNVNMENIIVLDRVMALYLTNFERVDRGNKLLELALPFAYVQPYISEAVLPPEMFVGRTKELADIQDVDGPVFVYGGRQLGKSALLRQARYITHHPNQGSYAYFIDIKHKNYERALSDISDELMRAGLFTEPVEDWNAFEGAMKTLLATRPIKKFMILLDETDDFLTSCQDIGNAPIEVLKNIRDYAEGRFKFILAGLHNVIRFDKRQLGGNTVFAQLGHIVIKPFNYLEAEELLLKPLGYLGFEVPQSDITSTILSKTNYFPGMIQYYGKKLVEAVRDGYKTKLFKVVQNPPYNLDDTYLTELLKDKTFLQKIEEKMIITLKLDTDNYYDIIALCVAYWYHYHDGITTPITAQDIQECCQDYQISRIGNMRIEQIQALIDELVDLNILHQYSDGTGYVFNRKNFFIMLGTWEEVDGKLNEYADK